MGLPCWGLNVIQSSLARGFPPLDGSCGMNVQSRHSKAEREAIGLIWFLYLAFRDNGLGSG